jgi:hypothetical protein
VAAAGGRSRTGVAGLGRGGWRDTTTELAISILSTTPAADGKRVVTCFATGSVACKVGDVIILVFRVEGKPSLLSARLASLFVPS